MSATAEVNHQIPQWMKDIANEGAVKWPNPFVVGDRLCVTEGHFIVSVPATGEPAGEAPPKNTEAVKKWLAVPTDSESMSLKHLLDYLGTCEFCNGSGLVTCGNCKGRKRFTCTCDCGDEHPATCEDCDENGKAKCYSCKFRPFLFDGQPLDRALLCKAVRNLQGDTFRFGHNHADRMLVLSGDDWKVVIMRLQSKEGIEDRYTPELAEASR